MLEEFILEHREEDKNLVIVRQGDIVSASYCAPFDRSTSEEINIQGVFPVEVYRKGIENLLMFGKSSLQGESRLELSDKSQKVILMTLYGRTNSISGVNLSLQPRAFLQYQDLENYANRLLDDMEHPDDSNIICMEAKALVNIGEAALDPLRKFIQNFYREEDNKSSNCLDAYNAAVKSLKEIEKT